MYQYGGALRGLLYPHIITTSRSEGSHSAPTTPVDNSSFTQYFETANTPLRRRSSVGYRPLVPATSSRHPLLQPNTKLYSRAYLSARMSREFGADLPTFSAVEQEAIFSAYANLATPPEGSGEDIGLDFNPHLPPWPITTTAAASPIADAGELPNLPDTPLASPKVAIAHRRSPSPLVHAVDAAADGIVVATNIPDSPLDLSHFQLETRSSFDTSVRDLVQSRPDSPIGGHHAAPTAPSTPITPVKPKRSFNVGTLVTQGRSPPRIEISCADSVSCCAPDMNKAPKSRSRASESQGSENHPLRSELQTGTRGNTPPMVTAPESLRALRRTDGSDGTADIDIDDSRLTVMEVRDFGLVSDGSRSKKASKVPDPEPQAPALSQEDSDSDDCEDCVSPMTVSQNKASLQHPSKLDEDTLSDTAKMSAEDVNQAKDVKNAKSAKATKDAKASKDTKDAKEVKASKNTKDSKDAKIVKDAKTTKNTKAAEHGKEEKAVPSGGSDPDYCEDCEIEDAKVAKDAKDAKDAKIAKEAAAAKSAKDTKAVKDANIAKTIQNAKVAKAAKIPPGIPKDVTGKLTAPGTPKLTKGKVVKGKVQIAIRKGRCAVLRTPVMNCFIGRQLGPSTCQALKLIGQGVAVERPKIVSTTPVPLPVPA